MKTTLAFLMFSLIFIGTAEARCFLFFCFRSHHIHPTAAGRFPIETTRNDPFCKGIKIAFAKSKNPDEDAFITAFPERKRDKVRECLQG